MNILSSDVLLASSHAVSSKLETQETLRAWIGDQRPDFEGRNAKVQVVAASPTSSTVQISDAARAAAQSGQAEAIQQSSDEVELDPRVLLIKSLVEMLTGKKIHLFHVADLHGGAGASAPSPASTPAQSAQAAQPPGKAGWGVEYDAHTSYTETEQTSFQASGVIRTADNQEISFSFSMDLQRSYHEESSVNIRAGDGRKIDPLVLSFNGTAAQLTSQKFAFDLDADGSKENISFVQGAGFLALDKNGDDKINDGKELFGTASGNGFADLKSYDSNGNNWIDEGDAIYQQLKIWTKDGQGHDQLSSLKQAQVGALFLGNISTPFALNNVQNQSLGQLATSGVWLSEDGKPGSLQQIDLTA